ncbi:MAG: Uma2 family endonuclease [Frankiaceae bacterium]
MSSVELGSLKVDLGRRYTIAELDDFPQDGRRYELADGWLLVSPMARRLRQLACMRLGAILEAAAPPELFVFNLPINVDDPDWTHFEPDLTVVGHEFRTIENGDLPQLAVEVRSPSTASRDAILKVQAYARLGIPSYWLVDVTVPSLCALELRDGAYEQVAYGDASDVVAIERPFPVRVVPASLIT